MISFEGWVSRACSRKAHSPNDIMNPKGVPTKGLWRKVFVKALPPIQTEQFKIAGEAENNSKFKTPNS